MPAQPRKLCSCSSERAFIVSGDEQPECPRDALQVLPLGIRATAKHGQDSRFCEVRNSEDQAEPVLSRVRSLPARQFRGSVLESCAEPAGRISVDPPELVAEGWLCNELSRRQPPFPRPLTWNLTAHQAMCQKNDQTFEGRAAGSQHGSTLAREGAEQALDYHQTPGSVPFCV